MSTQTLLFKSSKPAALPVKQPIRIELMINLERTHGLDLIIAPTLLFQAGEVIR